MTQNITKKWQFWPDSLRRQTLVGTILVVLITQLITIVMLSAFIIFPQMDRNIKLMARDVAVLTEIVSSAPADLRPILLEKFKALPEIEFWEGPTPPENTGPPPRALEKIAMHALALNLNAQDNELNWRTDGERKLWLEVYIGDVPYWISFKRIISYNRVNGIILISAILAAIFGSLMATRINKKLLSPLNRLKLATDRFSLANNLTLLEESGPLEISSLSHSFNRMTERLITAEKERSLVLAGISHDVRTPLTKLRLSLEMMRVGDQKLKADAERYIEQIDRILSNFMQFARGFDAEPAQYTDLNNWLKDIEQNYDGLETQLNTVTKPILVRPNALRRAVENLINNAEVYGKKPIVLNIHETQKNLVISVQDHGNGVDPSKIDLIRHPFIRAQSNLPEDNSIYSNTGTGLGLAIVEKIVSMHQGELVLENLKDGFLAQIIIPKSSQVISHAEPV